MKNVENQKDAQTAYRLSNSPSPAPAYVMAYSLVGSLPFARTVHLLASYWGFILMSVHAGNHIGAHTAKKKAVSVVFRIIAVVVSIYGAYAFVKRDISSYLFLKNQFVFFDFGQPKLWFFADFTSMICLFACVGAVISKCLKMLDILKSKENKYGQTKRN